MADQNAMPAAMVDTRSQQALDRIERALLRIEAAEQVPAAPAPDSSGFARLSARHNALRAEADATLAALNKLIEAQG